MASSTNRGRRFVKPNEQVYKEDHKGTLTRNQLRIGRNEPCQCGSGKKYKACCINKKLFVKEKL